MSKTVNISSTQMTQAKVWKAPSKACVVELLITTDVVIPMDTKGVKGAKTADKAKLPYFHKSSAVRSNLVNKAWISCYPC